MNDKPGSSPDASGLGARSMLGPIHVFGSGCFFVFGIIYLVFIHSSYMFVSNWAFGALSAANWVLVPARLGHPVRATTFLAIVYLGLVNVAVHLGLEPLPMVFWGMSVTVAAAFLFGVRGMTAWVVLTLGFYPLTAWLKEGPLADRAIPLDPDQAELLSEATYAGLLSFVGYTAVLFRRRLDRAVEAIQAHASALSRSESLLAESQQVARIGSYELDVRAGTWTGSGMLDEIFGIDATYPRDIEGWRALVHPEEREAMSRYLQDDVLTRRTPFDRDYRIIQQNSGREVWVHGHGRLYLGDDGRPTRMIGTVQDISGLQRTQEERRQLEARLFQSQKLESLGVLAGGIAHDFNNLLTGILGNVSLTRSLLPRERTDLDSSLGQAEMAALRAAELTHQMLAFAGKGQFVIQNVDVNATIEELVGLLKGSLGSKVVRFELDPRAPRIQADASQFRQVIMNLVINAAEAIGDGYGVITLRTDRRVVEASHLATGLGGAGLPGGEYACIEVADTGCGMDEQTQARLFDPFFSTKFTGRGLGLAAVLGIVKGHKAAIWLASQVNRGTTFTLMFPCSHDDEARVATTPDRERPERGAGLVLVVDDENIVRDVARTVLENSGFRVLEAADGAEGLDTVRSKGGEIDLVLLDLTMPKVDGVEAFRRMKELRPDLRVVLLSGYTRMNVLPLFSGLRPDDFLEKPFRHEELLAAVRNNLRGVAAGE